MSAPQGGGTGRPSRHRYQWNDCPEGGMHRKTASGRPAVDARAPQHSPDAAITPGPRRGADHIAPDCAGQNFYAIDRALRDLLAHYLSPADFAHLEPHFDRLGALAGGRLDELARLAAKHPPALHPRDPFGPAAGRIAYHAPHPQL